MSVCVCAFLSFFSLSADTNQETKNHRNENRFFGWVFFIIRIGWLVDRFEWLFSRKKNTFFYVFIYFNVPNDHLSRSSLSSSVFFSCLIVRTVWKRYQKRRERKLGGILNNGNTSTLWTDCHTARQIMNEWNRKRRWRRKKEEEETITPNEISLNPYRKTTKWGNFDAPF